MVRGNRVVVLNCCVVTESCCTKVNVHWINGVCSTEGCNWEWVGWKAATTLAGSTTGKARQSARQGKEIGKARKSARQLERHCCYGERGRMIIKFFPLFGFWQQGSWVGGAAAQRRRGSTV